MAYISSTMKFIGRSLRHPISAAKMFYAYLAALTVEGFTESKKLDEQQRVSDIEKIVDKFPYIQEQLNSLRPEDEKLSKDDIVHGLVEIDKVSATPLFSNFKQCAGFFSRVGKWTLDRVMGQLDRRSKDEIFVDRLSAMKKEFNVTGLVQGHIHKPADEIYVDEHEDVLHLINTHTWTNKEKSHDWGRQSYTWGNDHRGVGVIEVGIAPDGKTWSEMKLMKVVDDSGRLVKGDLVEAEKTKEKSKKKLMQTVNDIFLQQKQLQE